MPETDVSSKKAAAKSLPTENEGFPYDKVYKPLTRAQVFRKLGIQHDFRVVRVLPGALDDIVKCELVPSKLGSAPTYGALSYRAGDPTNFAL